MKSTIIDIKQDGNYLFEDIKGEIMKIYVESNEPLTGVDVEFITQESEIIFKGNLGNNIVQIYPFNNLFEQDRGDHYYSYGNLGLIVTGMIEGQTINKISVFYK